MMATDQTLNILNENYKSDKIKILDNYINKGYGSSIKRAIMVSKFDVIAIVDIDGQYPAKDVAEALQKYFNHKVNNIDMIIAQRTGSNYSGSIIKSFLRSALKFIVEWSTGTKDTRY